MIRRLLCAGGLAAALLVTSVPAADAATVSPDKWAPKFCTALDNWQTTIQEKGSSLGTELTGETDLDAARDKIAGYLGDMVDATDDAAAAIKKAGAPSSTNGAKISAVFVKGFKAVSKEFASAQKKAEKLSTASPAQFQAEGTALGNAISGSSDELGKNFSAIGKLDKKQELTKAVKAAPECSSLAS
jgi:hypothetical protein